MSYGDKVKYGGAPSTFNPNCVEDLSLVADAINDLYEKYYVIGGGYVPSGEDAATIAPSLPARHKVRFRTTEAMGSVTTGGAAAVVVGGDAVDLADAPPIVVFDSLGNYASAGSNKYGWAEYIQYPDDTYRFEIISLGGEGTVVGGGDDELVGVTSTDTPGYLLDKMYASGGWSPPGYDGGLHQAVWFEATGSAGNEFLVGYTSKQSAVETHQVLVSAADTTESYLYAAISAGSQSTAAFTSTDHQRVYARIDNASADETLTLYTKRTEDTGKVKTSSADSLDYLYDQFVDKDGFNTFKHNRVWSDSTGVPRSAIRLFVPSMLVAKLTETVPARAGNAWGSVGGVDLGYSNSGVWTSVLEDQSVYNVSLSAIYIPEGSDIHMPVFENNGDWILASPLQLEQLQNYTPTAEPGQSIGFNTDEPPQWQDDGECGSG